MKKKLLTVLLLAVLLVTTTVPAFADAIAVPSDGFFMRHQDECTYENRSYLANGQKGYITVKYAPDSLLEMANLPNGTSFRVEFVWQGKDGDQWGVGYTTMQGKRYSGWVSMSELAVIYDYLEFAKDHEAEFEEYDGSGDDLDSVYLYTYPGGVFYDTLLQEPKYLTFAEAFQNLYTDEKGLRWTFVGYYMGHRNAWACIDDPHNDSLGVDTHLTADQVRDSVAPVPSENTPPARTIHLWLVVAVLIVVVVVVTAVLIRRRKRT